MLPLIAKTNFKALGDELSQFIFGDREPDAFTLRRIESEVEKLPEPVEKLELKGFLAAAKGDVDHALDMLERAAHVFGSYQAAANALAIAHSRKCYLRAKKIAIRYADMMPRADLIQISFDYAALACNDHNLNILHNKIKAMSHFDDEAIMSIKIGKIQNVCHDAHQLCNVESIDIDALTDVGLSILTKNDLLLSEHELRVIDNTLVFVINVAETQATKIADLNMQAAFDLADNSQFDDKSVAVLFRHFTKTEEYHVSSTI